MPKAPATLDQFIEQIDRISMEKASSDRLASIDPNMPHVSPGYYSGQLQCVFASIEKSHPATSTIMPSGKAWHGTRLPDGWADVVTALEVIEHLENPRAFCRELARVAKPGGWVVVTTPNQLSLLSLLSLVVK